MKILVSVSFGSVGKYKHRSLKFYQSNRKNEALHMVVSIYNRKKEALRMVVSIYNIHYILILPFVKLLIVKKKLYVW